MRIPIRFFIVLSSILLIPLVTTIVAEESLVNHWFNGGLDDVRLYDRTLADTEVAKLYKSAVDKIPTKPVHLPPK